jgi:hypothetical protein
VKSSASAPAFTADCAAALSFAPTLTTIAAGRGFDAAACERPKNPMPELEDCLTCWSLSISLPMFVAFLPARGIFARHVRREARLVVDIRGAQ